MNELYRQILSGVTASVFLVGLTVLTSNVLWFNVLISAGIGIGMYLTIPRKKDPDEIEIAPGITKAQLDFATKILVEYSEKFSNLKRQYFRASSSQTIDDIIKTLNEISVHMEQDPRDLKNADFFLNHYLEKSYEIVSQYLRLKQLYQKEKDNRQIASMEKAVKNIHNGFKDFYQQCLQNDLIDFEVNVETLKSIASFDMTDLEHEERRTR